MGEGAGPRRRSPPGPTAARPGPTSGSRRATRPARPTRRCTPRRPTCSQRSTRTTTTCRRSPTRSSPVTFVDKIKVPTFMACQWTDEQTGGHCPTLAEHFTGTDRKWFTFTNGTHVDSLDPETFNRWYDFLQLYVAKQAPIANSAVIHAAAPLIYQEAMGITGRDAAAGPDPAAADLRRRRSPPSRQLKPVRVLFDNGAGGAARASPTPASSSPSPSFPIPGTRPAAWYLSPGGGLGDERAGEPGADAFTWDAARAAADRLHRRHRRRDGGLWTATPAYQWAEPAGQRRLLRHRAARRRHDRDRRRRRQRLGALLDARTSTCRRRSARSGPTARRPSCRTAGSAATSASSTRRRARRWSRC